MIHYDKKQLQIINSIAEQILLDSKGIHIIEAPAASGKTTLITGLIKKINEQLNISFDNTIATTYTRAGRRGLCEKFENNNIPVQNTKQGQKGVQVQTFHALALSVIRTLDKKPYAAIAENTFKYDKKSNRRKACTLEDQIDEISTYHTIASDILNENTSLSSVYTIKRLSDEVIKYAGDKDGYSNEELASIFTSKFNGDNKILISYTEMINRFNQACWEKNQNPQKAKILHQIFSNIKAIIIDEFQDNSNAIYDVLDNIKTINPFISLIFIGDFNQMIFETLNKINKQEVKNHPLFSKFDVYNYQLENNYRNPKNIVKFVNNFIINSNTLEHTLQQSCTSSSGNVSFYENISQNQAVEIIKDYYNMHSNFTILGNNKPDNQDYAIAPLIDSLRREDIPVNFYQKTSGKNNETDFDEKIQLLQNFLNNQSDKSLFEFLDLTSKNIYLNHNFLSSEDLTLFDLNDYLEQNEEFCQDELDFIAFLSTKQRIPSSKESRYMRKYINNSHIQESIANDIIQGKSSNSLEGPVYSTIYRAKGLEYENAIIILSPDTTMFQFRGTPQPKSLIESLTYTMFTRTKGDLIIICLKDSDKNPDEAYQKLIHTIKKSL